MRLLFSSAQQTCPDASFRVRPVQVCVAGSNSAPQFSDGAGQHASAVVRLVQHGHTRLVVMRPSASAAEMPSSSRMEAMVAELAATTKAAVPDYDRTRHRLALCAFMLTSPGPHVTLGWQDLEIESEIKPCLLLVALAERWVRAGRQAAAHL